MVNVGLNWRAWRGWYYSAQGDALCWICRPFGAGICGGFKFGWFYFNLGCWGCFIGVEG
jgi:hypothetical protein